MKSNMMYHFTHVISGTSVDWEVSLQLSSTGPSNILPPGWYFMPHRPDITTRNTSLFGNVPINNLNEWSLDKLGWYKTPQKGKARYHGRTRKDKKFNGDGNQVAAHTFSQVKQALNVDVHNCAENAHLYEVIINEKVVAHTSNVSSR